MEEQGNGKAKTILKTSLFTLLGASLAAIIALSVLCLASPRMMAGFTNRIGFRSFSTYLTRAAYEKSGDINDLGDLLERAAACGNYRVVEEYSAKMLAAENSEYPEFVNFKNKLLAESSELNGSITPDYDNFIKSNYVYALYQNGKSGEAFDKAKDFVIKKDAHYGYNNPMTRFVYAFEADEKPGFDAAVVNLFFRERYEDTKALYAITPEAFKSDLKNICMDGYIVAKKAGDESEKTYWEREYIQYKA